jgi:hypothetical protein
MKIKELKYILTDGMHMDFKLFYADKNMEDNHTIDDYIIRNNDTINIIPCIKTDSLYEQIKYKEIIYTFYKQQKTHHAFEIYVNYFNEYV